MAGPSGLPLGAAPAALGPPAAGSLAQQPTAATPSSEVGDWPAIPAQLSDGLGLTLPAALVGRPENLAQPYFLESARSPSHISSVPSPQLSAAPAPVAPAEKAISPSISSPVQGPGSIPAGHPPDPTPEPLGPYWIAPRFADAAGPVTRPVPTGRANDFRPELVPDLGSSTRIFDGHAIKKDFPILQERVHGRPLVWLDNAATTQKPQVVIDRLSHYYTRENSNVHRAAHTLAARATDAYEGARDTVRRFLNAPSRRDIVFVRGTTEAINLIAKSWGERYLGPNDEIVITWLEHHANIVPWQQLCASKGACLRVAPVDSRGQVILEEYEKLLGPRTRLVSISQVSNALGTVVPVREMIAMAHRHGALAVVDGAQAVSHMRVDVQALDCDFYCFSGHKVFAPTGIGVLYGKSDVLAATPPWQGGGNMISDVTFEKTTYQPPPARFEAGTNSIGDAAGLGTALDYLMALGLENVSRYEHELLVYGTEALATVPGLRMIGTAHEKAAVFSFVLDGIRTEDVGAALDQEGIAVRSGHHCAQPILRRFGVEATVRASLAPYNTREDLDALVAALLRLQGRPALAPPA
ncbi:MAG: family 2A encapsulin nanocompartment cargo protein cysteine desulfurase [Polyangiaceae bacterium]